MSGRRWGEDELERLRREYPTGRTDTLAAALGRSVSSVYNRADAEGLRKTAGYMSEVGRERLAKYGMLLKEFQFRRGHEPHNKGVSFRPGGRSLDYLFKPGHTPGNKLLVGTERHKKGYRERKIYDTGDRRVDWRAVHQWVWEQRNGPVPAGSCVIFIDGDRENCALENLALVTRAELAYLNKNGFSRVSAGLRPAAIATARLSTAVRRADREEDMEGKV